MRLNKFYPLVDSIDELNRRIYEGFDFIQLRVKQKDESLIKQAIIIAKQRKIKLIINDYVDLVAKYDGEGVHLGKSDMPVKQARDLLGYEKIIGATTNSFEDIENVMGLVDYVGLGPYKFTTTKDNLAPILGEKIVDIKAQLDKAEIDIPIYIIGGITTGDIDGIIELGFGVAGKTLFEKRYDR